jgi:hypothetical protein
MLVPSNISVDPVPFGHWTLRDEAAQRRSSPRWAAKKNESRMPRRVLPILVALLVGCTSMNRYSGGDAAYMPVPCDASTFTAVDGKTYKPYVTLVEVDGSFIGSGHGCMSPYTYSLKPGQHRFKVASNFDSPSNNFIIYAIHEFSADIKLNTEYVLSYTFDGKEISTKIAEKATGLVAGIGSTTDTKVSTKSNAALQALPFIVK